MVPDNQNRIVRFFDTFSFPGMAKISISIVNFTNELEEKDLNRKIYIGVITEKSEVQPECK